MRLRVGLVVCLPLLELAGCVYVEDISSPAPGPDIVWDVDSDGRMELLSDGLWSAEPLSGKLLEVGDFRSYYGFPADLGRSRGPRVGGAGAVLLLGDSEACPGAGIRALAADGTSACVATDDEAVGEVLASFVALAQAQGPECLIRSPIGDGAAAIGCTTSELGWQGWATLSAPSQLDGHRWLPCGGVAQPPGRVGMLVCTNELLGWASVSVDGGELDYVPFSAANEAVGMVGEDPRFPDHFGVGGPNQPTRLCEVADWEAGDIGCEVIDAQDAISSVQLMALEPGQTTPAVFIRSEEGDRQWLYWNGERREVTVAWPDRAATSPDSRPSGTVTVVDADGDGVDELAVRDWYEFVPVLLEFDGDAGFVPFTP